MLLNFLREVPDVRRGQGRCYDLANLLYVVILAMLSGATSYNGCLSKFFTRMTICLT